MCPRKRICWEFLFAFVAQLVEQWIEDPRVGGSTPSEGTMGVWRNWQTHLV